MVPDVLDGDVVKTFRGALFQVLVRGSAEEDILQVFLAVFFIR